ncbi:MAG: response regulator transcription factor [Bacteriovoracaceae bacterium]|nr:response regulator transcription factor [Bacteriovoracaceae bacterium]
MLRILLLEDEINLGTTLSEYLNSKGHQCHWVQTIQEAERELQKDFFHVALLDIGLPDGSGLDFGKKIRKHSPQTVLLFLSALNDPETKVQGLEIGAEDYITKPFALKEITLRLERILKNREITATLPEEIQIGGLKIRFRQFEVVDGNGENIALSQKECAILEMLYQNKNEAVNRDDIIEKIWGEDKYPSQRTVDNYIVKLRKWCETDQQKKVEIQSIRSIGYKLHIIN